MKVIDIDILNKLIMYNPEYVIECVMAHHHTFRFFVNFYFFIRNDFLRYTIFIIKKIIISEVIYNSCIMCDTLIHTPLYIYMYCIIPQLKSFEETSCMKNKKIRKKTNLEKKKVS